MEVRAPVAQVFVVERAYSHLNGPFDEVLTEGRTNPPGEAASVAPPLMRIVAGAVDAAGSQRARRFPC